jgi:hypothetical protein
VSVVCPAGVARAPRVTVWSFLTDPRLYGAWMDVRPVGGWDRPIRQGDVAGMRARPVPLGVRWDVVEADEEAGRLRLGIDLPLGIHNDETITVVARGEQETLVRFY